MTLIPAFAIPAQLPLALALAITQNSRCLLVCARRKATMSSPLDTGLPIWQSLLKKQLARLGFGQTPTPARLLQKSFHALPTCHKDQS
jgi:hypothetical protein